MKLNFSDIKIYYDIYNNKENIKSNKLAIQIGNDGLPISLIPIISDIHDKPIIIEDEIQIIPDNIVELLDILDEIENNKNGDKLSILFFDVETNEWKYREFILLYNSISKKILDDDIKIYRTSFDFNSLILTDTPDEYITVTDELFSNDLLSYEDGVFKKYVNKQELFEKLVDIYNRYKNIPYMKSYMDKIDDCFHELITKGDCEIPFIDLEEIKNKIK